MKPRDIQEALDYCLANPDNLEAEQLLARFPQYREELAPLVGLVHRIESSPPPAVPTDRRAAMKAHVLAAAAVPKGSPTQQNTQPVVAAPGIAVRPARAPKPRGVAWLLGQRLVWASAGAMVLLVAFFWMASANALADSPFYGLKLAAENVQVNLASSPAQLVRLHSDLATRRVREARTMAAYDKLQAAAIILDNYGEHADAGLAALAAVTGSERSQLPQLAQMLYTSGEEGRRTFAALQNVPNLPGPIEAEIKQALADAVQVQDVSERVLVSAGIDPRTIPTPKVPDLDWAWATPAVPAAGGATPVNSPAEPTAIAAATASELASRSQAAAYTQLAVPQAPGSAGAQAAKTVVAASNPSGPTANPTHLANAQQTVLSAGTAISARATTATPPAAAAPTGIAAQATAIAAASRTPRSVGAASPTRTDTAVPGQPSRTRTPGPPPSTRVPPSPAATRIPPRATDTPTPVPPVSTATRTNTPVPPGSTATQTPVPPTPTATNTQLPPTGTRTNTPVPPSATPTSTLVPPTATFTPTFTPTDTPQPTSTATATTQPAATHTFTAVPTATNTPVATLCNLEVQSMSVACASTTCVSWMAIVANSAIREVTVTWIADLQVNLRGAGGYQTVASEEGQYAFAPGLNTFGEDICFDFSPDTQRIRVRLRFDTTGHNCNPQGTSSAIDPCDAPALTPSVGPTGTPHPGATATPTEEK